MSAARDELAAWAAIGEEEDAGRRRVSPTDPRVVRRIAVTLAHRRHQLAVAELDEATALLGEALDHARSCLAEVRAAETLVRGAAEAEREEGWT